MRKVLSVLGAFCIAISLSACTTSATAPRFSGRPTAVERDGNVEISFTADRFTDVTVSVLDSEGRTVRHLVSGVLGDNPPPPLQPGTLRQTLVWDGNDNFGQPAEGGPFQVRVAMGLEPEFQELIGNNPAYIGDIRSMAVGPDGKLYVIHCFGEHHRGDASAAIAVFDRAGRYQRTIAPFPSDMPADKLKGVRTIKLDNGSRVPFVYQFETRSYLPGLGDIPRHRSVVTSDGRLVFSSIQEGPRCYAQPGESRITVINTDGSVPDDGILKSLIHPLTDTSASLALSPDEDIIYAAGVRAGLHPNEPGGKFVCDTCDHMGGHAWRHTIPVPMVFHTGWEDRQVGVFLGQGGRRHGPDLTKPISVATDADGNVYVADIEDGRVVVVSPDRELLGEIEIEGAMRVEVHRETGEIYVLTGPSELNLVKFDGYEDPTEVARLRLGTLRWPRPIHRPIIALDDRADPPVIWTNYYFSRIEDLGDRFGEPVRVLNPELNGPRPRLQASVMEVTVDRINNLLYLNNRMQKDLDTGEWTTIETAGGRMWPRSSPMSASGAAGRDGLYYVHLGARRSRVLRYGPDMAEREFPTPESVRIVDGDERPLPHEEIPPDEPVTWQEGGLRGYARNYGQGHTADYEGNVYVLFKKLGMVADEDDFHRATVLTKFAPDGRRLDAKLINCQKPGIYSPRVDREGNIYVAVGLRPGDKTVPEELRGQVSEGAECPDATNNWNSYPMIYGSIVKFGPEGGEIFKDAGGARANFAFNDPIDVKGAEWIVPGTSVVGSWASPKHTPGTTISCVCENPCIDVDEWGRTFFPDAGRARVGVLDTAGNLITTFGRYGNPDSQGLHFWWPQAVGVNDTHAFVGDRLNRRTVVVRLVYSREMTIDIE